LEFRRVLFRSRPVRIVAVRDFSGLTNSACALAKADASAATESLDRRMVGLRLQDVNGHRARLRAFGSYPMPDGFLGVLGHQGLELAFRPLVVEKGMPGVAEQLCELGPRIGRAHIDDADGIDTRPRRLGID